MRTQVISALDQTIDSGIEYRVASAVAASIGSRASPLYSSARGILAPSILEPVSAATLFDLASLTKIIATTLIAAEATLLGKLSLSEQPFEQWPGVSVEDILQHTSGLPAWVNLYERPVNRKHTIEKALSIKLEAQVHSRTLYSDIGFIALGDLLEKRLKAPLEIIFDDLAKRYYQTTTLRYNPSKQERALCAPTGFCNFRKRHLQGEVNDLNAFAMGGVAGHAGVFGTIDNAERVARFFLQSACSPKSAIEKTLQHFMQAAGARAIGFDRADKKGSTAGVLSAHAVGHLGFTGTSLWIDPQAHAGQGAYFVLLTNHVELSTRKTDILHLRREFHRLAHRLF